MSLKRTNDFVIRFADKDQISARIFGHIFTRAAFLSGVPATPKVITSADCRTPGLCDVRFNGRGYLGRRREWQLAVPLHPENFIDTYNGVAKGGYFLYNSNLPLPAECEREDLIVLAVPATSLCAEPGHSDENMALAGALTFFLNLSITRIAPLFTRTSATSVRTLNAGYLWAKENYPVRTCGLSLKESRAVRDSILISGRTATALGALYGGATFVSGHDSSGLADEFRELNRHRGETAAAVTFRADDGNEALAGVLGATWRGSRAFTVTSAPAQMGEALGFACFAELPAVVVNVQCAPGMQHRTMQADLLTAAFAARGDTRYPLLFPCNPHECFTMTALAFDLADHLQTPVLLMSDHDLHNSLAVTEPLHRNGSSAGDRGQLVTGEELDAIAGDWERYATVGKDGVCPRTLPGSHRRRGAWIAGGAAHTVRGEYSEDPDSYEETLRRLLVKWESARPLMPIPHSAFRDPENRLGILFYGTSAHASYEAVGLFSARDIRFNTLRIRSFPFHYEVEDFIKDHRRIFLVEQNRDGQMRQLLVNELGRTAEKIELIRSYDGIPISVDFVEQQLARRL